MIVVADAGPIIHLAEVGALRFLESFQRVILPGEVWHETVDTQRVNAKQLEEIKSVERTAVSSVEVEQFIGHYKLTHLQRGEQECLFFCHQQKIETLLTDDMAVRTVAKQHGITPVGSLGIIVRAFHTQAVTLTDAERFLHQLHDESSLFVTRAIVELAIEQLHRQGKKGR